MNEPLIRKTNLFGAWSGIVFNVLLVAGWIVVAGFFPLHRPSAGADEIAQIFRNDATRITIGMIIVMWGAAFTIPWTATLTTYIAKIEGRYGPLTLITLLAGFANAILVFYPPTLWIANSFRAQQRSAEMIYMVNDLAWLQFLGGVSLAAPMLLTVAVAALNDKSPHPVFPRWFGFASILTFVLLFPDQFLFFFKSGPFAWNGLIAFWIPIPLFGGWIMLVSILLRRAVLKEIRMH